MAEIKLVLVLENKWPPYWIFASSFDFDYLFFIGMSFCIVIPNFIKIGLLWAAL